jgi:hypothetical protein
MIPLSEQLARDYLRDLHARLGGPDDWETEVRRLAAVLERAIAEERQACAEIAEETMRLYGSNAAEQVALLIRAREGAS